MVQTVWHEVTRELSRKDGSLLFPLHVYPLSVSNENELFHVESIDVYYRPVLSECLISQTGQIFSRPLVHQVGD